MAVGDGGFGDALERVDGLMRGVGEADADALGERLSRVGEVLGDSGGGEVVKDLAERHVEGVGDVVECGVRGEHRAHDVGLSGREGRQVGEVDCHNANVELRRGLAR